MYHRHLMFLLALVLFVLGFLCLWQGLSMDAREKSVMTLMKAGDDDACMRELRDWIKDPAAPNKATAYKLVAHMCAKKGNPEAAKVYDALAKGAK